MVNTKNKIVRDVVLIPLEGKLMDASSTSMVSNQLKDLLEKGYNKIVRDFGKVDWINSLAIGNLIKWFFIVRENGGDLRITNTKHKVQQYLTITKLKTVIQTFENSQQAIDSFSHAA